MGDLLGILVVIVKVVFWVLCLTSGLWLFLYLRCKHMYDNLSELCNDELLSIRQKINKYERIIEKQESEIELMKTGWYQDESEY